MSAELYAGEDLSATYASGEASGFCRATGATRAFGRFKGKVAIVTGAAGNFGAACAERLAAEGASVALFDVRSPEAVRQRLAKPALGGGLLSRQKHTSHVVDVTDEQAVTAGVAAAVAAHGRVDYLCNNAGYQGDFAPAADYDAADFAKVLTINATGAFHVLKAVANAMREQKPRGGVIVNTASMAAHSAPPNMPAYATSKAAVKHMTVACAKDLAPHDIRVCSVSPAYIGPGVLWTRQVEKQAQAGSMYYDADPAVVATQMINAVPMRRYGSIDEVIGPILFLFSDDASYLTGVDIQITGGIN